MKRIFLFLVTNLAVLALLTVVIFVIERVFGIRLGQGGLGGLLLMAAVCGVGGALISLVLSKWTAQRLLGVRVVTQPQSDLQAWLVGTLRRLAVQARIGMRLRMVAQLVLGVFASMIVSWYSRRREFRTDRGGATLAGTASMIGALEALKRSQGESCPRRSRLLASTPAAQAALCVYS
jgi:Zn-dependent protease with chaperone function